MQKCKRSYRFLALLFVFALVLGSVPSMPLYAEVDLYEGYEYQLSQNSLDELDIEEKPDYKDIYENDKCEYLICDVAEYDDECEYLTNCDDEFDDDSEYNVYEEATDEDCAEYNREYEDFGILLVENFSTGLSLAPDGTIDLAQTGNWSAVSTAAVGITPSVEHFAYTVFPVITDPPVVESALQVNNPGFGPPANARGTLNLTSEQGLNWDLGVNPKWNRFNLTFMFRTWNLGTMQVVYTFFDATGDVISTGTATSVTAGQQGWNGSLGGNYQKRSVSFLTPDASGQIIDKVELQFISNINAEATDPFFVYGLMFDYVRPTISELDGVVDFTHFDEWIAVTTATGLSPDVTVNTTDAEEIALKITDHGFDISGNVLTLTHTGLTWSLQDWNQFHFDFIYPRGGSSATNFRLTAFNENNQQVFVSSVQDLMTPVNVDIPPNYRTQSAVLNFAPPAAVVATIQLEIWFEGLINALPVYITGMRFIQADFSGDFSFGNYIGWSAEPIGDGATGSPTATVPSDPGDRLQIANTGVTAGGNNVWRGVRLNSPTGLDLELDPIWNMISFDVFIQDGTHRNIYTELSAFDANGQRVIFDGHRVESSANNNPVAGFRLYTHTLWFEPKISGDVVADNFHLDIWLNNTALETSIYITDLVFNTGTIPSGAGAMSSLMPGVRVGQLNYPNAVSIVDQNATPNTKRLLAFMHGIAESDYMLIGMQNPTFINAGGGGQRFTATRFPNRPPTSNHANVAVSGLRDDILYFNDMAMITGEYPAIMGFDTLSFFTFEAAGASNPANRRLGSAALARQWAANGGIVTLSAHMPNFGLLIDDPLINVNPYSNAAEAIAAFGNPSANYGGRNSCTATGGNTMSRILPGGDANQLFRHYLDLVAEFALELQQHDIPVLFRPFHETNGSWFWWGDAFVSPEGFKNVWRYTVEYLRDYRGVHNLLYVISPNGPFPTEEVFAARYPGNEWVDIIGFDQYLDFPGTSEGFATTVRVVSEFARRNGKVAALTEYGHQPTSNHPHNAAEHQPTYHADILRVLSDAGNFAYMLVWHNTYAYRFTPFLSSPTRGYPSLPAYINNFVNSTQTVFAGGHGFYNMTSNITAGTAHTTGWIVTPVAGSFVTEGTMVAASVRNVAGDIYIRLFTHGGVEITRRATQNNVTSYYEVTFTDEEIASVVGNAGGFEVVVGGQVIGWSNMIFDEPYVMPYYMIDDFEGYFGNVALLNHTWTMGDVSDASAVVSLCSVNVPNISGNQYSMRYEYTLFNVSAWLGVIRSIEGNFSEYDGISFWANGNGESVMLQLRYGGNGFEASVTVDGPGFYFVPFSAFVRAGWSASPAPLNLNNTIEGFQIFVNAPSGSTFPLSGVMYFDHIQANVSFTLSYDLNGATGSIPAERVTVEDAYFRTADMTGIIPPEGKIISEWNTEPDGSGTSVAVGEYIVMPAQNITLYAIWVNPVTVSFYNQEQLVTTQAIVPGQMVVRPEDPVRENYIFGGWETEEGILWNFNSTVNNDISLYARWTLEIVIDFSALQELVDRVLELNPDEFTTESWANLATMLANAREVLANHLITQAQVDAAHVALQDAVNVLVPATPPCCNYYPYCECAYESNVDFSALEELVSRAGELNQNIYTANSWANMTAARTAAKEVLTNPEATQEEVNSAYDLLKAAIDAMVLDSVVQPPPLLPPQPLPQPPPPPQPTPPSVPHPYIPWAPRASAQQPVADDTITDDDGYIEVSFVDEDDYVEIIGDDEVDAEYAPPQLINTLIFTVGNIEYLFNNNTRVSVGVPFIDPVTDRMMIPLRTLSEALGVEVVWDSATRSAVIFLPTGTISIPVDEMLPDGMGSAMIIDDRTFIPLRFVMYAFDANVEWDSANRAAVITW